MRSITLLAILATVLSLGLFLTACQEMATSPADGGFLATVTVTVEGTVMKVTPGRGTTLMVGTTVKLLDSSDNIVGTDSTDINGAYSITSSPLNSTSDMSMLIVDNGTDHSDEIPRPLTTISTNYINIQYYPGVCIRVEQKESELER